MKPLRKVLLVMIVLLVAGTAVFIAGSKPAQIQYPSPNGYDDIFNATEVIQYLPGRSEDPTKLETEERKWLIQSNSTALNRLREGLGKEIMLVIPTDPAAPESMQYLMGVKKLSQLLAAEADVAAASSNRSALLSACFDNYALGSKGTHGGRWIEGLVGIAIRAIALKGMSHIQDLGDAAFCRKAAVMLFAATTNAPTASAYQNGEDAWVATQPLGDRFNFEELKRWISGERRRQKQHFSGRFDYIHHREAETLRDLAAAAFRLEHGRAATNWTELVPEYLPEIPRNATNNVPLPLVGP